MGRHCCLCSKEIPSSVASHAQSASAEIHPLMQWKLGEEVLPCSPAGENSGRTENTAWDLSAVSLDRKLLTHWNSRRDVLNGVILLCLDTLIDG